MFFLGVPCTVPSGSKYVCTREARWWEATLSVLRVTVITTTRKVCLALDNHDPKQPLPRAHTARSRDAAGWQPWALRRHCAPRSLSTTAQWPAACVCACSVHCHCDGSRCRALYILSRKFATTHGDSARPWTCWRTARCPAPRPPLERPVWRTMTPSRLSCASMQPHLTSHSHQAAPAAGRPCLARAGPGVHERAGTN